MPGKTDPSAKTEALAAGANGTGPATTAVVDPMGMGLASLCLIHCLLLPVLAAMLPVLGLAAEAEWLHKLFVLAAIPTSLWALAKRIQQKARAWFAMAVVVGLGLLISAAFVPPLEEFETPLTVAGAIVLFAAHFAWWRQHRNHQ